MLFLCLIFILDPHGSYLHIDKELRIADDYRKELTVHSPYLDNS